jgi:AraC-like DNA-binding protein
MGVSNSTRCWSAFHECFALTSVPEKPKGMGTWRYRKWQASTVPGSVMLMEPDTAHRTLRIDGGPASFDVLFVERSVVESVIHDLEISDPGHFDRPDSTDGAVTAIFRRLHRLLASDGAEEPEVRELIRGGISNLFNGAGERRLRVPRDHDEMLVARARALLHRLARAEGAPVADIAAIARSLGCNYHWLIHVFTAQVGLAPYQYFLRCRLERARQALLRGATSSTRTLADVAAVSGYSDLAHMDRHFIRFLGMSPSAFLVRMNAAHRWKHVASTVGGGPSSNPRPSRAQTQNAVVTEIDPGPATTATSGAA